MNNLKYNRRSRRRRCRTPHAAVILGCAALIGICGAGAVFFGRKLLPDPHSSSGDAVLITQEAGSRTDPGASNPDGSDVSGISAGGAGADGPDTSAGSQASTADSASAELLNQAAALAVGYNYDGAIALLQSDETFAEDPSVLEAIAGYEAVKETLVQAKISEVTHVFFHSLVMDTSKAFDNDVDTDGYNQVMTTANEFKKILQTMYDKGYVLVRLHDLAYETTDGNGNAVMKPGSILLPEGKIPFVMSQDDVCYYPYMNGDGFASRIVIGEDGKPTCEMTLDDGTVSTGSYDLVPILEDFIQEHPDFSYKGARAVLAFTGYEGILGYRTAASYADSPTYAQDREQAAKVAQCLKDNGWELASHSWGHLNMGTIEMDRFRTDVDKWEQEVDSLIGPTDIILYPFGADVSDWHPYSKENERFNYLYNAGFRYFCNVDSSQHWVQLGDNYLRQGRRNLDGYRMWKDITAEDPASRKLEDLFHAEDVFDPARPTPVPDM